MTQTAHTWTCPACGRRVPRRADACHCGTARDEAEALLAAREAAEAPRPRRPRLPVTRREVVAAMPGDVKALLGASALVFVVGLGWLLFTPSRPPSTPAVLGYVDAAPPPPRPTPSPGPPFPLPWWR